MEFMKYDKKGYHWVDIGFNLRRSNSFVKARYNYCITLLKDMLNQLKILKF